MSDMNAPRNLDEVARLARAIMNGRIAPSLSPTDNGRFIAIDVNTAEYEIDDDDLAAVMKLHARVSGADAWLECIGDEAFCRMGFRTTWGVELDPDDAI